MPTFIDCFLGELRIMSFNFPPLGWAQCNGQLLPINQNQALFSLLGTTYGGNGQTNFALPDLRGRVPMHLGAGFTQGERAGEEAHTLQQAEMPTHIHFGQASNTDGDGPAPGNTAVLASSPTKFYNSASAVTTLAPGTIGNVGGSQPHENMQPFLTVNVCIALQGIFPSQT
jgi:microcystin-dependent protein